MGEFYVGLDLGTSFVKAGLLDPADGKLVHSVRQKAPELDRDRAGLQRQCDAEPFVEIASTLLSQYCRQYTVAGIVVCSQMGGLVVADEDGVAVGPYLSWQDKRATQPHRGQTYFDQLSQIATDHWSRRLGNELRPGLPISFLYWMAQNNCLPSSGRPMALGDYVVSRLCGCDAVSEWTLATGSADVTTGHWPSELLTMLGLSDLKWPTLVNYQQVAGRYQLDGTSVPMYAAVGDHQCALVGSLLQREELSINISTGSQVSLLTDQSQVDAFQLRPFFDSMFLRSVTHIPAGRALEAIVNLLCEYGKSRSPGADPWDYVFQQAEAAEDSEIQVNLSFFPCVTPGPGALVNLTEANMSVGSVFRAALSQMANHYAEYALAISPQRQWKQVVYSGGIAQRSDLLRSMIGAKLGHAYRLSTSTEDTMIGLMMIARVVSGMNRNIEEAIQEYIEQRR